MGHPQSRATAAGVTACGTAVMILLAVRTGRDTYALAGLVGTAMTAGAFLRYVHALVTAHAGSSPPDLVDPPSETRTDRNGSDTLDGFGDR